MKNKFRIYGIYMIVYLLLLPTLVTLGAIACINHLGDDGYFTVQTVANIANIGVTAASIFLFTYTFWANKGTKLIPSFTSPLNYGPCAVMSAALIFIAAHLVIKSGILKGSLNAFPFIVGMLALLALLYFVMSALSVKRRSIMRSDFGIIVLIFLCGYIAYIFFDKGTPINAPTKVATMMAFLFFALFFLYETRLSLGREKWHLYVTFAFISSLTSAYASIPALIVYITDGRVIGISIYETVLVFAFFIFSTFKLFLVGELVPERGSSLVDKLIESASARIEELKPEEPVAEEVDTPDENQFSILDGEDNTEEYATSTGEATDETAENTENEPSSDSQASIFENDDENTAVKDEKSEETPTRVTKQAQDDTVEEEKSDRSGEENPEPNAGDEASTSRIAEATTDGEKSLANTEENKQNADTRVTFSEEKDNINQ